jgi:hypothetical protein
LFESFSFGLCSIVRCQKVSERHPMGLSTMREKYSNLYQSLRVRDYECMK